MRLGLDMILGLVMQYQGPGMSADQTRDQGQMADGRSQNRMGIGDLGPGQSSGRQAGLSDAAPEVEWASGYSEGQMWVSRGPEVSGLPGVRALCNLHN